jgi:hypothetical protein
MIILLDSSESQLSVERIYRTSSRLNLYLHSGACVDGIMSWSLAVAHRSYRAVTVFCRRPLLLHSIQHRRLHALPPVPLARSYVSQVA